MNFLLLLLTRQRARLAAHGGLIFAFGMLLGIGFGVSQCQGQPPDYVHRWEVAHMQGLVHGVLLIAMAAGLAFIYFSPPLLGFVTWTAVIGAWAAVVGSAVAAIYEVDGRVWGPPLANQIAFVLFAAGVVGLVLSFLVVSLRAGWDRVRVLLTSNRWHNWARTVSVRPRRRVRPATLGELQDAVLQARAAHLSIRAVGGGFSWNPGPACNGVMIQLGRLNQVLDVSTTPGAESITVEAGVTMKELVDHAASSGLTLETTTVIPYVQVGGAFANGCHGTGLGHPHFTDLVSRIQLVDASGALQTFDRPDFSMPVPVDVQRRWDALVCNLGLLGVVYSLTFDCVPIYNVREVDVHQDMETTLENVETLVTSHDYAEVFWFPYNDDCWVKTWDKEPVEPPSDWQWQDWLRSVRQWFQNKILGPVLLTLTSLFPFITPPVMRLFGSMVGEGNRVVPLPEALQYQTSFMDSVDLGYAIPVGASFDNVRTAWWGVVRRLRGLRAEHIYPQNLVMHLRFVGPGRGLLSPSTGNDRSCYIEILTYKNTPRFEDYFEDVEREWIELGGRPHWGKLIFDTDHVRTRAYGAQMAEFAMVRDQMDPDRVFVNDWARELVDL